MNVTVFFRKDDSCKCAAMAEWLRRLTRNETTRYQMGSPA